MKATEKRDKVKEPTRRERDKVKEPTRWEVMRLTQ